VQTFQIIRYETTIVNRQNDYYIYFMPTFAFSLIVLVFFFSN